MYKKQVCTKGIPLLRDVQNLDQTGKNMLSGTGPDPNKNMLSGTGQDRTQKHTFRNRTGPDQMLSGTRPDRTGYIFKMFGTS